MALSADETGNGWGFNELLLVGVILLMLTGLGIGTALYVMPTESLEIPELQPAVRVARVAEFPVGASRIVNWGERIVLVVRSAEDQYAALQGTAPNNGCILRWDDDSRRIVSPCSHLVYDLHGHVVAGLTTEPLQRYSVSVRGGVVAVTD
jgi:nitrite reductase/ring-hydroxylating ferredoxin subunit